MFENSEDRSGTERLSRLDILGPERLSGLDILFLEYERAEKLSLELTEDFVELKAHRISDR